MKIFPLLLSMLLISQFSLTCMAQDSTKEDKTSYFKLSAHYLSNAVYSGRKDSTPVPYFKPGIGYHHKSGFFINAGISVLVSPSEPSHVDLINTEVGYEFKIRDNFSGSISAAKYFYADASFAAGSELKGGVGANISYDNPIATIGLGGELLFSTKTDVVTNINLSHGFNINAVDGLSITPSFQVNAGSQYFNQAYYEYRKYTIPTINNSGSGSGGSSNGSGRGRGHSYGGGSSTTTTQAITFTNNNRFSILDYEFSMPINYDKKKWGLFLTPYYVRPVNPTTFALNGVLQNEPLSNTFFFEMGLYLKLQK